MICLPSNIVTFSQMNCFVYWIYDETCLDPITSGYVGVSKNAIQKFSSHIRKPRVPKNSKFKILFEGTREECFKLEFFLRPSKGIGWNKAVGGAQGWRIGFSHSNETKQRLHRAWTEERRKIASKFKTEQNKLLIGQKRPKQSEAMTGEKNPMFGTTRPQYVIDAVRNAHLGKPSCNRQEIYCVGCHERVNMTTLNKYHKKCFVMYSEKFSEYDEAKKEGKS
jgi:hypothetical protein